MIRKSLKIAAGTIVITAIVVAVTALQHPIFLKGLGGSARIIGKPVPATIYITGKENTAVRVFHVGSYRNGEEADYFLLYIPSENSRKKVVSLNRKDNYAGIPSSDGKRAMTFSMDNCFKARQELSSHCLPMI
jgi:hypothetical protein